MKYFISVLRMREKAISGMMALWRDTDVEELEERNSHLKKVQLLSLCVCMLMC